MPSRLTSRSRIGRTCSNHLERDTGCTRHDRNSGPNDARLLKRNLFERAPENAHVIQADAGDDTRIRPNRRGRIQATTEPNLEHRPPRRTRSEMQQCEGRDQLEECRWNLRVNNLQISDETLDGIIWNLEPVHPNTLVEAKQMRAGELTDRSPSWHESAGFVQDARDHSCRAALAVCACNLNDLQSVFGMTQDLEQGSHPFQTGMNSTFLLGEQPIDG
jgi:hypothetical protein